jgi:hypothetical protein
MSDVATWTNPHTQKEHFVGQRVMWVFGRKDNAEYGETGTVVSIPGETGTGEFSVQMDQPRNKRDTNSGRLMHFTTDSLITIRDAHLATATRLRAVADQYQEAADRYTEFGMPIPSEVVSS